MTPQTVLTFWFEEIDEADHFKTNPTVDEAIKERFSDAHTAAAAGELANWADTPEGTLALIIVLDQFSRNLFRGDGRSFAYDDLALTLAEAAIEKGFDMHFEPDQRLFIYLPFMHSESREVHARAVPLFESLGLESSLKYEHIHKDIIDRFGRYPHRNEVLGRESTAEELEYLANNQESFF